MKCLMLAALVWAGAALAEPPAAGVTSDNAAARYLALLPLRHDKMDSLVAWMSRGSLAFEVEDENGKVDVERAKLLSVLLRAQRDWFDGVLAATALQKCEWSADRLAVDADVPLEHVAFMSGAQNRTCRAMEAEVRRRWAEGDPDGAVGMAIGMARLSWHASKSRRSFLDALAADAHMKRALELLELMVQDERVVASQRDRVLKGLAAVEAEDPSGSRAAVIAHVSELGAFTRSHVAAGAADDRLCAMAKESRRMWRLLRLNGLGPGERVDKARVFEIDQAAQQAEFEELYKKVTAADVGAACVKITPELLDALCGPWTGEAFDKAMAVVRELGESDETGIGAMYATPLGMVPRWADRREQLQRVRDAAKRQSSVR